MRYSRLETVSLFCVFWVDFVVEFDVLIVENVPYRRIIIVALCRRFYLDIERNLTSKKKYMDLGNLLDVFDVRT